MKDLRELKLEFSLKESEKEKEEYINFIIKNIESIYKNDIEKGNYEVEWYYKMLKSEIYKHWIKTKNHSKIEEKKDSAFKVLESQELDKIEYFLPYIINIMIGIYHKNGTLTKVHYKFLEVVEENTIYKCILHYAQYSFFEEDFLIEILHKHYIESGELSNKLYDLIVFLILLSFYKKTNRKENKYNLHYKILSELINTLEEKEERKKLSKVIQKEIFNKLKADNSIGLIEEKENKSHTFKQYFNALGKKRIGENYEDIKKYIVNMADIIKGNFLDYIVDKTDKHSTYEKKNELYFDSLLEMKNESTIFLKIVDCFRKEETAIKYFEQKGEEIFSTSFVNNNFKEVLDELSNLYKEQNKIQEGIEELKKIETINNDYVIAGYLSSAEEFDLAISYYEKCLEEVENDDQKMYISDEIDELKFEKEEYEEELREEKKEEQRRKEKELEIKLKEEKERPAKIENAYFNVLNKLQRRILYTIYNLLKTNDKVSVEQIEAASGIKNKNDFLINNLNKIIKEEIIFVENRFVVSIDETAEKRIAKQVDPEVEAQIIKADDETLYKTIFFHESEKRLYKVLIELFPQALVFPNMSLHTIIDYEKLKNKVTNDTFDYYLKTHADFVVVSTNNYLPMIAIEKDSDYHDNPKQQKKDGMKNTIFSCSGIPLVRVRFNNAMEHEKLKEQVIIKTKEYILEHKEKDDIFSKTLINSIDLGKFEKIKEMDFEKVMEKWEDIVGELIAKESKLESFKDGSLNIEVPKGFSKILESSVEEFENKMNEEFPLIKKIILKYF